MADIINVVDVKPIESSVSIVDGETTVIIIEKPIPDLCECGKESQYGVHGFTDDGLENKYYCINCYNRNKRKSNEDG